MSPKARSLAESDAPPPSFAPYSASFETRSDGSILSFDDHLNKDPEALYQFLLEHGSRPPHFHLDVLGAHIENRPAPHISSRHSSSNDSDARVRSDSTESLRVVDFEFSIDLTRILCAGARGEPFVDPLALPPGTGASSSILPNLPADEPKPQEYSPTFFVLPDAVPAHRGGSGRTVWDPRARPKSDVLSWKDPGAAKALGWRETRARALRRERRLKGGAPPWDALVEEPPKTKGRAGTSSEVAPLLLEEGQAGLASKSLREVVEEYCASTRRIKEFNFNKVVYGWDLAQLERALRAAIASTSYRHPVTLTFRTTHSRISVRPHSRLSYLLSRNWFQVVLIITLLWIPLFFYNHFHQGQAKWNVVGSAWPLKRREKEKEHGRGQAVSGLEEPLWFETWERRIRRAVESGLKGELRPEGGLVVAQVPRVEEAFY